MPKSTTIQIGKSHLAHVKSTGVVHNLLKTGETSRLAREEKAARGGPTFADLWPKNPGKP